MTPEELAQVAAAQAIVNELNARFCGSGSRYTDSLRSMLDEELLYEYAETGTDRKRIIINGVPVGTYSVVAGKPQEVRELVVEDEGAYLDWLCGTEDGRLVLQSLLHGRDCKALMNAALGMLEHHGIMPGGCSLNTSTIAGRPHTQVRVVQSDFAHAVGTLQGAVALLDAGEVSE